MNRGRSKEKDKPIVYVTEGHGKCDDAIEYLTVRRVGFEAVDVSKDEEGRNQLMKATGQTKTPTAIYRGDILRDFGLHELKGFLDKHKLD